MAEDHLPDMYEYLRNGHLLKIKWKYSTKNRLELHMLISLSYWERYQMTSVKIRQKETFKKCINMNLQLAVGNITKYNNESLSGSLFH